MPTSAQAQVALVNGSCVPQAGMLALISSLSIQHRTYANTKQNSPFLSCSDIAEHSGYRLSRDLILILEQEWRLWLMCQQERVR